MNRTITLTLEALAGSGSSRSARLLLDQSLYPLAYVNAAAEQLKESCVVYVEPDGPDAFWLTVQLKPEQPHAIFPVLGELLNHALILNARQKQKATSETGR